jgi:alginate O-acetyltransferase complex protein AlgJ
MIDASSCTHAFVARGRRPYLLLGLLLFVFVSLPPANTIANESVLVGKDGWLFPNWESLTKSDKPAIDATIALIRHAKDLFAARNIGLVVMVVPMKATFYPQRLPAGQAVSPAVKERYKYILEALKRAQITTFDLDPVLHRVENGTQTAFYRADYHWTAQAAEASADAAAEVIRKGWTLTGKNGTGAPLGPWINERRYGDLAANFMSPEERTSVGKDLYVVRDTAKHKNLLDDNPAPVQVVGNSFVLPYLGFTQKLSNDLDRPVGLTGNPGNVGPWATMLQCVQSPGFAKQPPQVILWQFNEAQLQNRPDTPGAWDSGSNIAPEAWRARMTQALQQH